MFKDYAGHSVQRFEKNKTIDNLTWKLFQGSKTLRNIVTFQKYILLWQVKLKTNC